MIWTSAIVATILGWFAPGWLGIDTTDTTFLRGASAGFAGLLVMMITIILDDKIERLLRKIRPRADRKAPASPPTRPTHIR